MKNYLILTGIVSAVFLTACGSDSNDDNPVTPPKDEAYVPSQYKNLSDNFKYVVEPLTEIQQNYLYNMSYWVDENPLIISSYSYLFPAVNGQFKTQIYTTSGPSGQNWLQDSATSLLFNIAKNTWIESDGALTMSQGPVGTEGIKSLYVKSDTGVNYYTLTEKNLSGLSLDQGMNPGFGNGIQLPDAIKTRYFSAGAKAYAWVQDITQPVYSIRRTHMVFSSTYKVHPINSCRSVSRYCSSISSNLEDAIQNQAWYLNTGKNGSIQIRDQHTADMEVFNAELQQNQNYTLNYQVVAAQQGQPKHILFTPPNAQTLKVLQDYFNAGDGQLAWYEYNNQVVNGDYSLPIKGLQSSQYSYNKTAINDILTQWTPRKNPVLE